MPLSWTPVQLSLALSKDLSLQVRTASKSVLLVFITTESNGLFTGNNWGLQSLPTGGIQTHMNQSHKVLYTLFTVGGH